MKRYLCLRFPRWPLQRLLATQPELRGGPLALYERDARRVERVVVCSPAAAAAGIVPGMPLGEAHALVLPSPAGTMQQLVAYPTEPLRDWEALQFLAESCERFSPLVGWDPIDLPDKIQSNQTRLDYLLLDVTGIGPLFGDEETLAAQVAVLCRSRGYEPQVAIAETMGGAWALAAAGDSNEASAKGVGFPSTPRVVPSGELLPAMEPLSVTLLRLDEKTNQLLLQLGVRQVADLCRLPRSGLATRFGQQTLLRLDRVLGAAAETLILHRPPNTFQATWRLEYPSTSSELLAHLMERLVERVAIALTNARQGALQLECHLEAAGREPVVCRVGLYRPAASADYLWSLLRVPWEQGQLPGEVHCIQVAATLTAPLEQYQQQLFVDATRPVGDRELTSLLERLGSRLGINAVLRPQATGDALPERAYEWVPWLGGSGARRPKPTKRKLSSSQASGDGQAAEPENLHSTLCLRPSSLLREPQPIEALSVAPDGPPESFVWRGRQWRVMRHWGPERIETGWQRGPTVRRDYYRVETAQGEWFWIFRLLPRRGWFLQGVFD